jgi:hypothetical protein
VGREQKERREDVQLGYHPILMLLLAMVNSIKLPPHYQIVPMTLGYLPGAVRKEKK